MVNIEQGEVTVKFWDDVASIKNKSSFALKERKLISAID